MKPSIQRLEQSKASYDRPHGTIARFEQGCRCLKCRAEKASRVARRKAAVLAGTHQFNGIVSAVPVRNHLLRLSKVGVGVRAVAAVTDINVRKLKDIRAQRKPNLRAGDARKILSVTKDALADGARVPARRTRSLIRVLNREGFTQAELARRIGRKGRFSIRNQRFVFARTEMQIEKLYKRIMAA